MTLSLIIEEAFNYFTTLPLLELSAVISALLYVVLAAKGNIWCWPAAFISTVIYSAIFYDVYLWMDSILQLYYMVMAIYGWYCWREANTSAQIVTAQSAPSKAMIKTWGLLLHVKIIAILSLISLVLGGLMANYTPADFPFYDAATTVFAIFATYMVTKKILENWLYWVVIDLASIYLYLAKGLTPTAVLFALYVVLALYGYLQWQNTYRKQQPVSL